MGRKKDRSPDRLKDRRLLDIADGVLPYHKVCLRLLEHNKDLMTPEEWRDYKRRLGQWPQPEDDEGLANPDPALDIPGYPRPRR